MPQSNSSLNVMTDIPRKDRFLPRTNEDLIDYTWEDIVHSDGFLPQILANLKDGICGQY